MGASSSKPARKLAEKVSKSAPLGSGSVSAPLIPPTAQIKPLSSRKTPFDAQRSAPNVTKSKSEIPEYTSKDLEISQFRPAAGSTFDAAKLGRKLQARQRLSELQKQPENKDGYDPDIGPDAGFSLAVMRLGAQIHSKSENSPIDRNFSGILQLQSRKLQHEIGERENRTDLPPPPGGRTMVHPRTLGAILNDIKDPRTNSELVTADYGLHKDFLSQLGWRFQTAEVVLHEKEEAKDGEILVQDTAPSPNGTNFGNETAATHEMDADGHLKEIDPERFQKLKLRLD